MGGFLLLVGAVPAHAVGDLHWSSDTTLTVGAFTVTIQGGSDATTFMVNDNSTLTVSVPSNHSFVLTIPVGNSLVTSPTSIEQSCGTPNSITVSGPSTYTITPQAVQCTKGTTVISGGGGGGGATTPKTPQTTDQKTTAAKPFTFEVPKVTAPSTPSQGAAMPSTGADMKAEIKEIALVPKKIVFDADDKQILAEAKKAGVTVAISGKGSKAQAGSTKQNALVLNFLTKETDTLQDLSLKEKVQVLAEAQYLTGGPIKNEAGIAKALKVAEGLPLNDKELGKKALTDIKRNEAAFCKKDTCKGFDTFDRILRGGEVSGLSNSQQAKGVALFKKNTKRAPDLKNPLHQNLVQAFALADLTVIKAKPVTTKKK